MMLLHGIAKSISQSITCKRVKTCTDTIEIQARQRGESTDSCPNKTFAHNIETLKQCVKIHRRNNKIYKDQFIVITAL